MMQLKSAHFDRALPFMVGGKRLQNTISADHRGVEYLALMDNGFVFVRLEGTFHLLPPHRLVSCTPEQAPVAEAPAKRRGRPPGSKNKEKLDDEPAEPPSEGLPSD